MKHAILKSILFSGLVFTFANTFARPSMEYSPNPLEFSYLGYEKLGDAIDFRSARLNDVEVLEVDCVQAYYYCTRREIRFSAYVSGNMNPDREEFVCDIRFRMGQGMVFINNCRNSDDILNFSAIIPFEELDLDTHYGQF